ncbi:putative tail protein [Aeromonas phage Ahp2]|nr:putative tail protein [Aeromonas phage Ahp2]
MSKKLTYIYTTKVDELLDEIVFNHYESHQWLQMVLEANPGIAKHGPRLPIGLEITLPPEPVSEKKYISLWD